MSEQDIREHMDNGVSVHMCPNGHSKNLARHLKASQVFSDGFSDGENGMSEQDTREKLEADIATWASKDKSIPLFARTVIITYDHLLDWLDRQAAITERETRAIRCFACNWADERAELTAERDNLQAAIDAMGNGQFYAMYRKACDERDHFKDLVRKQSDSNHKTNKVMCLVIGLLKT